MSKHTPGPWVAAPYDGFGPVTTVRQGCAKTGMRIASTFQTTSPENIQRNEANARLIAASPELLVALQKAVRYGGLYPDLQAEALAAIAKATGENT